MGKAPVVASLEQQIEYLSRQLYYVETKNTYWREADIAEAYQTIYSVDNDK